MKINLPEEEHLEWLSKELRAKLMEDKYDITVTVQSLCKRSQIIDFHAELDEDESDEEEEMDDDMEDDKDVESDEEKDDKDAESDEEKDDKDAESDEEKME